MFSANSSQVSEDRLYVEDVFSVYVYAGNNTSQTITNGIDLSGKGGMVWTKDRTSAYNNVIVDSTRSLSQGLITNNTNPNTGITGDVTSFNSNGYSLGNVTGWFNNSGDNYASWTFRKAPKFFDVVTYTGNGSTARAISHSLGVAPGSMIIKRTDSSGQWVVYHRSLGNANALILESTIAQFNTNTFGYTTPDATTFTVGDYNNINGATYVAYLFAHDTTSDGIIQCGSFTNDGSGNATVNLGWEPQWLLLKKTAVNSNWQLYDNMRGFFAPSQVNKYLYPNSSGAEGDDASKIASPTATGFTIQGFGLDQPVIYIAIRRGPMRTPTSGTSVYNALLRTGNGSAFSQTGLGFTPDTLITTDRGAAYTGWKSFYDRLRGVAPQLNSTSNNAEITSNPITSFDMDGASFTSNAYFSGSGANYIFWYLKRAPSFFDEVCYTGNASNRTINHNLGVAPELMIIKSRSSGGSSQYDWIVYSAAIWGTGVAGYPGYDLAVLNTTAPAYYDNALLNNTQPSASVFSLGTGTQVNSSGVTYVAYLFGSCPGVSKCGSYTGNGSSQTINCGFAAGARFVMIKRADNTGDWYVWDSARGIVAGNDPRLSLNTTDAEVTTDDSVDTNSSGFVVNQLSATNINVSSATYIYLAVA